MGTLLQDVVYAARQLSKSWTFTITAILTLGLGIGVNAAMFSVIDQVLLRSLPYADPDKLVIMGGTQPGGGFGTTSFPDLQDWQQRSHSFQQLGFFTVQFPTLGGTENPRLVGQVLTSANILDLLQAKPATGRSFTANDGRAGQENVVLLSDHISRDLYHADPNIVGRTVPINGTPYAVIGVMPASFDFPASIGDDVIWSPVPVDDKNLQARNSSLLTAIARLRPGVTTAQAASELNGIHEQLRQEYPNDENNEPIRVETYRDVLTEHVRPSLLALHGAVIAVWLIACANIAGLMLTRTNNRRREIAIRSTLGAGRGRLVQQFLTESLLLSMAGGLLGLLVAAGALRLLRHYLENAIVFGQGIHINAAVCGYLFLASCISAVLFGLMPAWMAAKVPAATGLREGAATGNTRRKQSFVRDALIIGEIALTLMLLATAGLMMRTLFALRHTDLGFASNHVVTGAIYVPNHSTIYVSAAPSAGENMVTAFYQPLEQRLAQLPGVDSVGLTTVRPLDGGFRFDITVEFEGRPKPERNAQMDAQARASSPDYFKTMGIRLLQGRFFSGEDSPAAKPAAIVNQAFVSRFLPDENPLGVGVRLNEQGPRQWATIVGVVDNSHQRSAGEAPLPEINYNLHQLTPQDELYPILGTFHMDLAVRTRQKPESIIPAIERTVHSLRADVAVNDVETMDAVVDRSMGNQVLASRLLGIFSAAALVIAIAGIYGLLAYSVSQRTREFGIRLALGAQRKQMLSLVLRQALRILQVGVALGLVLVFFTRKVLASYVYGLHDYDLPTIAVVVFLLGGCGLLASYFPARRAASIDPMQSLRME